MLAVGAENVMHQNTSIAVVQSSNRSNGFDFDGDFRG